MMNTSKPKTFFLLTALVMSACCQRADAETLDAAIGALTKRLSSYLQTKGETSLSIGSFGGPPQLAATSGPSIVKLFHEHFSKHKIAISKRARIGLKGEYVLTKTGAGGIGVKIKGSLVDAFGDVLTDFTVSAEPGSIEHVVDQHEDVVQLLGATAHVHPEDHVDDQNADLKKQILHPQLHVQGTKCGAAAGSPYQIEVLVKGRPLPINVEDGLGFCGINHSDIYVVRIHNNSDYDAAVRLSIDGLNIFTFSEIRNPDGKPKYQFYIVPPHSKADLKGWHKTNEHVSSFLLTSYADSAAATIDHHQDIGTITAVFSAAWPKGGGRPHDERSTPKGSGNATGFGPLVAEHVKPVKRQIGKLRASISLRYSK